MPARSPAVVTIPPLTKSIATRVDAASVALAAAGAKAVAAIPGNPRGVDVRRFGNAVAFRNRTRPDFEWENRVFGLTADDLDRLPRILAFFRKHGCRPYVEISQFRLDEAVGRALHEAGLYPHDVYPLHYGTLQPAEPAPLPTGMVIRPSPDEEIERWVRIFFEGFGLYESAWDEVLQRRRAWFCAPGFRRYLGLLDGEPVAIAGLFIHRGTAMLDPATTLPRARGRGFQQALIHKRLADAAAAGCDLAGVETSWASISHRNQQRAGLDVAFNRVVFTAPQSERT